MTSEDMAAVIAVIKLLRESREALGYCEPTTEGSQLLIERSNEALLTAMIDLQEALEIEHNQAHLGDYSCKDCGRAYNTLHDRQAGLTVVEIGNCACDTGIHISKRFNDQM